MKTFIFIATLLMVNIAWAQVGKGTLGTKVKPAVTVNNKGQTLAGKSTKTTVSNNGIHLNTYSAATSLPTDSLIYQIITHGSLFSQMKFRALNIEISSGTANPGVGEMIATFLKYADSNSTGLQQTFLLGDSIDKLELFYYTQGSTTPYKSVKFINAKPVDFQFGLSDNGEAGNGVAAETVSITFTAYGFKDWVNNSSFRYDLASKTVGT